MLFRYNCALARMQSINESEITAATVTQERDGSINKRALEMSCSVPNSDKFDYFVANDVFGNLGHILCALYLTGER